MNKVLVTLFFFDYLVGCVSYAKNIDDLELLDPSDIDVMNDAPIAKPVDLTTKETNDIDDLESLKEDIGNMIFDSNKSNNMKKVGQEQDPSTLNSANKNSTTVNDTEHITKKLKGNIGNSAVVLFDIGGEEKKLLELSRFVEGKIPDKEWDEISAAAQLDKYVIQKGDWLWKISQRLFGSGFYYSKIWSLNPQITNPHEIEPGMTLIFSTGDTNSMPQVSLGSFSGNSGYDDKDAQKKATQSDYVDFKDFGDQVKPEWIDERKRLINDGIYFQYASEETYDDLKSIASENLNTQYEEYSPPVPDIVIQEPGEQYDNSGFDKNSKIIFNVKEGFFLNTFVTSNIVQDLGVIDGMGKENIYISQFDHIFANFDRSVKVKPGDLFSVYIAGGKVQNKVSDRSGYKYSIGAQAKALRKINNLWECEITELSGLVQRGDRMTVYTPKIGKIIKTFNKRNIEAAIIASYESASGSVSYGNVVYLDRGRADGVEMGTVFEIYSFMDRGLDKRLTADPTYKVGEVTVISLTDNFATALVTNSKIDIAMGSIALTKTEEQAALAAANNNRSILGKVKDIESKALDELDIELSLDDISKDLLEKADQVQLTEDELEELERQEREKSIIKDHERDLKELDRLESEILEAEESLNEAKVDEDKFLEAQNLNNVERNVKGTDPNAFESLNDIEDEVGLKFLDEDLNSKENPYGLTEFDLEEVDELLNTDKL